MDIRIIEPMRQVLPITRVWASLLVLSLALPSPAWALRGLEIRQNASGLEELENRLRESEDQADTVSSGTALNADLTLPEMVPDLPDLSSVGGVSTEQNHSFWSTYRSSFLLAVPEISSGISEQPSNETEESSLEEQLQNKLDALLEQYNSSPESERVVEGELLDLLSSRHPAWVRLYVAGHFPFADEVFPEEPRAELVASRMELIELANQELLTPSEDPRAQAQAFGFLTSHRHYLRMERLGSSSWNWSEEKQREQDLVLHVLGNPSRVADAISNITGDYDAKILDQYMYLIDNSGIPYEEKMELQLRIVSTPSVNIDVRGSILSDLLNVSMNTMRGDYQGRFGQVARGILEISGVDEQAISEAIGYLQMEDSDFAQSSLDFLRRTEGKDYMTGYFFIHRMRDEAASLELVANDPSIDLRVRLHALTVLLDKHEQEPTVDPSLRKRVTRFLQELGQDQNPGDNVSGKIAAQVLDSPFGAVELKVINLAVLIELEAAAPSVVTPERVQTIARLVANSKLQRNYDNASATHLYGASILRRVGSQGFLMVVAHELGHNILQSIGYPYAGIHERAIHEYFSDSLAIVFANHMRFEQGQIDFFNEIVDKHVERHRQKPSDQPVVSAHGASRIHIAAIRVELQPRALGFRNDAWRGVLDVSYKQILGDSARRTVLDQWMVDPKFSIKSLDETEEALAFDQLVSVSLAGIAPEAFVPFEIAEPKESVRTWRVSRGKPQGQAVLSLEENAAFPTGGLEEAWEDKLRDWRSWYQAKRREILETPRLQGKIDILREIQRMAKAELKEIEALENAEVTAKGPSPYLQYNPRSTSWAQGLTKNVEPVWEEREISRYYYHGTSLGIARVSAIRGFLGGIVGIEKTMEIDEDLLGAINEEKKWDEVYIASVEPSGLSRTFGEVLVEVINYADRIVRPARSVLAYYAFRAAWENESRKERFPSVGDFLQRAILRIPKEDVQGVSGSFGLSQAGTKEPIPLQRTQVLVDRDIHYPRTPPILGSNLSGDDPESLRYLSMESRLLLDNRETRLLDGMMSAADSEDNEIPMYYSEAIGNAVIEKWRPVKELVASVGLEEDPSAVLQKLSVSTSAGGLEEELDTLLTPTVEAQLVNQGFVRLDQSRYLLDPAKLTFNPTRAFVQGGLEELEGLSDIAAVIPMKADSTVEAIRFFEEQGVDGRDVIFANLGILTPTEVTASLPLVDPPPGVVGLPEGTKLTVPEVLALAALSKRVGPVYIVNATRFISRTGKVLLLLQAA